MLLFGVFCDADLDDLSRDGGRSELISLISALATSATGFIPKF